ncbi:hypothetical protein GCM10007415_39170 [Parapedobacter pyrenivorans]|uniref:Starch-binding associating with outer membrane n=1 Tax=Parapedobacter pyrenivorans TaxID=1305674 RepID=A0A917I0H7_9SPHI|nr:RagB/SusD family nutrient uptake outer membrane protein [Parapedobacter pyrenivorans]GGG99544.1 hypothetical protein GCM10007415_39170 [Parapedobacter pyrenivorans]
MKTFLNYTLMLVLGFVLSSCEKDLNPIIYDRIAPNNFFQNENDLRAATTSIYWELKTNGWGPYRVSDGSAFIMNEGATGEWMTKWSWDAFQSLNWIIGEKMVYGFYESIVPAVTRATYMIERIKESPVDDAVKNKYIAELKCLRGFFAADLYHFYGPLPIIVDRELAYNPSPDYRPERPSKEWMTGFIEQELREAADMLPVTQQDYGRCTKGAALMKLMKFYMNEKEWQKARDVSSELMGLGYALQEDYQQIFSAANEGNSELIFVVTSEPREGFGLLLFSNMLPPDYRSSVGVDYAAWNGWRVPWSFYDSFEPGDKRRDRILTKYPSKAGGEVDMRAAGEPGGLSFKYPEDPNNPGQWAGNDQVIFRYADVLLARAEILNELNGPNQESIDLINQVRDRAFGAGGQSPEVIVVDEQFEGNFTDNAVGAITVNNFQEDQASLSYRTATNDALSASKAVNLSIANPGTEWWAIQVRADNIEVEEGKSYSVSFKALADKDVSFSFRAEGSIAHTQNITLKANEVTEVSFELSTPHATGGSVLFLALGNSAADYDLWIDDLVVKKNAATGGGGGYRLELADYAGKEALRDRILLERGWELWWEGVRREDLLRHGSYLDVAKQHGGSNASSKNLLFPIPNWALIENPNIIQNDGYN